jgi:hypothetical protein
MTLRERAEAMRRYCQRWDVWEEDGDNSPVPPVEWFEEQLRAAVEENAGGSVTGRLAARMFGIEP